MVFNDKKCIENIVCKWHTPCLNLNMLTWLNMERVADKTCCGCLGWSLSLPKKTEVVPNPQTLHCCPPPPPPPPPPLSPPFPSLNAYLRGGGGGGIYLGRPGWYQQTKLIGIWSTSHVTFHTDINMVVRGTIRKVMDHMNSQTITWMASSMTWSFIKVVFSGDFHTKK